jgi:AraC family transcriptional regulator
VRVALVYLRPRRVGFVRLHGPSKTVGSQAWAEMTAWLKRHSLVEQITCGYGLALDGVVDQQSRYDACVELPDGYENLKVDSLPFQHLPGGAFARIRHIGSYRTIDKAVLTVKEQWLPDQPRLLLDRRRPLLVVYLDQPASRESSKLRCDVCVPVRTHHDDAISRGKAPLAEAFAG